MSDKLKNNLKTSLLAVGVCAFLTVFLLLIVYINGFAPFGNSSFACMDAEIQYLDFFSMLKRALQGETTFAYTLEKVLGSNNIAVFAYYLTSPLNFIVLFFEQSEFNSMLTVLVICKLVIAGICMTVYLRSRFPKLSLFFAGMLATGFALCQYSFSQASNIMWLDGMYMLPLIMLATYRLVGNPAKKPMLIITVGLTIVFNWYTGLINCIYAVFYYIYEDALKNKFTDIKSYALRALRFVICLILGVGLSLFLLLPAMLALLGGRGGIDFFVLGYSYISSIASVLWNYRLGATGNEGVVSLYSGFIVLLGVFQWIVTGAEKGKGRYATAIFLAFNLIMFAFPVFFFLFSLGKHASSYWYRYAYLAIFGIVMIAARYYERLGKEEISFKFKKRWYILIVAFICLIPLQYLMSAAIDILSPLMFIVSSVLILPQVFLYNKIRQGGEDEKGIAGKTGETVEASAFECESKGVAVKASSKKVYKILIIAFSVLLSVAFVFEQGINASRLMDIYKLSDVEAYRNYVIEQNNQIESLEAYDDGFYRINQTTTRNYSDGITANYNESMAYGYYTVNGYTSDPDDRTRTFLDKLGYNIMGGNMNIVVTSNVAADSLLGVKYVLSDKDFDAYESVKDVTDANGKSVYYNPYALPMAFKYTPNNITYNQDETNPFEYQNQIYSYLYGKEVNIWQEAETKITNSGNTIVKTSPANGYPTYAYVKLTGNDGYVGSTVNGGNYMKIGGWLSGDMLYLPQDENGNIELVLQHNSVSTLEVYTLDLDLFRTVTQKLQNNAIDGADFKDGNTSVTVSGSNGEYAYFSMAYDRGMKIKLNGKSVDYTLVGDCMIGVPLEDGENRIEISFSIPGLGLGIAVSVISLGLTILLIVCGYKNKKVLELPFVLSVKNKVKSLTSKRTKEEDNEH